MCGYGRSSPSCSARVVANKRVLDLDGGMQRRAEDDGRAAEGELIGQREEGEDVRRVEARVLVVRKSRARVALVSAVAVRVARVV